MRIGTCVVVLVIHAVFFLLFATLRKPAPRSVEELTSLGYFLPLKETPARPEGALQPSRAARATFPAGPKRVAPAAKLPDAIVRPEPQGESKTITPPATPDWRRDMQIAANNTIETQERKRHQPSPLAPHDFSGVKPGSTDNTKPRFGWNHAATHRVEEIPTGGVIININDRCAVAWLIFPFPFCRIGKIPVRGDLFDHLKDAPATQP